MKYLKQNASTREIVERVNFLIKHFDYKTGTGSPVGTVTPDFIQQMYLDTENENWYKSTGLTSTQWKLTT